MPSRLAILSVEITWRCGYPPCAPTACSMPFALPRGLTYRGESGQKFHLQLSFVSFGTALQCFGDAPLRHIAGDAQIGLMGFHQKPVCQGTECSAIYGCLDVSNGMSRK